MFATVCEKISQGESKSSARLRASDKASFKAVEEIPELREFRQYLDPHQFNLKIYKLIDNYFEDMNVITTKTIERLATLANISLDDSYKDINYENNFYLFFNLML